MPYFRGECPYSNESFRGEIKNFLNDLEKKFPGVKFNLLRAYLSMRGELQKAVEFDRMFPNYEKNINMESMVQMLMGGEEKKAKSARPSSTITKCKNCGQNSSTDLCKACSFVLEIERKKMEIGNKKKGSPIKN